MKGLCPECLTMHKPDEDCPVRNSFELQLATLVSKSLSDSRGDPEQMGVIIERLLYSLSLVIAVAARGDKAGIERFLMGAESYLAETTLDLVPLACAMFKTGERRGAVG